MLPPITMPSIRRSIKPNAVKNKGLKDILSPTAKALEVLSVDVLEYQVYNTQAVVLVEEDGVVEERVLIYNRIDLRSVLSNYRGVEGNIDDIIELMNQDGYDVTLDDVYLDGSQVKVKETSLGYYEGEVEVGNCAVSHYFKVRLLGDDRNQSWYDVHDALSNSFVNLTAPTQPQLEFVIDRQNILNDGVYQYTIVGVGILNYSNNGADENISAQFTLPRLEGISTEWSEILPIGPIYTIEPQFSTLTTFGSDDSHTIVRCIVTRQSLPE